MFIDNVTIYVKAGDGGDGAVSFHRENMLPRADPTAATADTGEM